MEKQKIHLVSTGGTIEKVYCERSGVLGNKNSIIASLLQYKLRLPTVELCFHDLMSKDSLDLTEEDRHKIFNFVQGLALSNEPIIILHGTDTIRDTFSYFESRLYNFSIPVIFTGAMRPIGFTDSDALQNITEALFATRLLAPGLYLSFHSQIFKGSSFLKNYEIGTFVKENSL